MKYREFIEDNFLIDEPVNGEVVPFKFRPVQLKYYEELDQSYGVKNDLQGLREIILKARRLGWSSLVLAIFAADMILSKNPKQYLCLSYKQEATQKLFRRFKLFIESYCQKKGYDPKQFVKTNNSNTLELTHNGSLFYIGTASARTGERGGTVQGIHFSEAAHYPDTELLTAQEIIEATMRQVDINGGMIFVESTANGYGNYYQELWQSAIDGISRFKPRFFGWREFYTQEEFAKIASEFVDQEKLKQEYPGTPEEAFLSSGRPFFSPETLQWYKSMCREPIKQGYILPGTPPVIDDNPAGFWKFWALPEQGEQYYISCDIGDVSDFSSAGVIKRKTLELVATLHTHLDPGSLAQNLSLAGTLYNRALIAPEKNSLGLATLTALKNLNYANIYRRKSVGMISDQDKDELGWLTTSSTRPLMLGDLQAMTAERSLKIYDLDVVKEMETFVRHEKTGKPQALPGKHDDRVIMLSILARLVQEQPYFADFQQQFNIAEVVRQNQINKNKFRIGR